MMSLACWFRDDVTRLLAGVTSAAASTSEAFPTTEPQLAEAYRRGFADAIRAVAAGFGVRLRQPGEVEEWL
jgi:hypothetical protein